MELSVAQTEQSYDTFWVLEADYQISDHRSMFSQLSDLAHTRSLSYSLERRAGSWFLQLRPEGHSG